MSHVGRKAGLSANRVIAAARAFLGPVGVCIRDAEIAALPTVEWKGRTLYTLRCQGTSGKGHHDVHVPLAHVWHLVWLDRFFCVYHAGDAFGVPFP